MLQILINFFRSKAVKKAFKLFASLASVIFVVSGYVFFQKNRNDDEGAELGESDAPTIEINSEPVGDDDQPSGKVHFLFRNKKG
ncbi:MAG: hypothetical protein QNL04_03245 [SAR324 cluster bacterium]|nr:hypothetical protein [SAR324 cluster bacterium]